MVSSRSLLPALLVGALLVTGCDRDDAPDAPGAAPADLDAPAGDDVPDQEGTPAPDPTAGPEVAPDSGDAMTYVALGDSLATGAGATTSYVEEYAEGLRTRTGVDVELTNFAIDGWTSQDLLTSLYDDEGVRAAVADADLVSLDIGGNDLLRALPLFLSDRCGGDDGLQCFRDATDGFEERWGEILDELLDLRGGDATGIVTLDLYLPFVGDERLADDLERLRPSLDAVNATIASAADARDIPVAQVHTAFHGEDGQGDPEDDFLISVDGIHPSNAGHRLIAEELLALGVAWAHTD
ncbi:SGNH/GDSL hydrolase family protein [Egicoccus sp. AB-alg6-2]|uniref:SGNH/GDSL hydrolase family protein n=1 Tax=Egicoccus sp. AB-alg6-2 TaxID=3242692 RepID=UPI00359D952A